jgi:hypothetical protein
MTLGGFVLENYLFGKRDQPMQDELIEIKIDFEEMREQQEQLDEAFANMFGNWISYMMRAMFGEIEIPISVKGKPSEVRSFATALGKEKKYVETAKRYGLADPRTYKSKNLLKNATSKFEKITGIKWPFK